MSDTSQGEGWWLASDGRWYPPHLRPGALAPPPSAAPWGQPAGPDPGTSASHRPAGPSSPGYAPPGSSGPGYAPPGSWAPGYAPPGPWGPGYAPPGPWGPGYGPPGPWGSRPVYVDRLVGLPLAPWWKRLLAILIDTAILAAALLAVLFVIAGIGGGSQASSTSPPPSGGAVLAGMLVLWLIASVPAAVYFAAMNGSRRGQTVGKLAIGIAVSDADGARSIGFGRALGRFLFTVVLTIVVIPYLLDSLAPLWDDRRQAWHDRAVRSVVVDLRP